MPDLHDLVAPYALDALDVEEAATFESHLESCEQCRRDLGALREGTADLAESVALGPPAHIKEAVLEATAPVTAPVISIPRRRPALAWAAAGVAAALALVFLGLWSVTNARLGAVDRVAAVYEAPDTVVMQLETETGPARFAYSASLGRGVFNGGALDTTAGTEVYQLWLIGGDGPESAGTLQAGDSDVLVQSIRPGVTLAMTIEPSPGVDSPTGEPLFAAEL